MLYLHSLSHLLVDALCAATLFGPVVSGGGDYATLSLLYSTLAFATQCLVGLAADRLRRHRLGAGLSMLVVVLGFVLPLPPTLRVVLIGLGNSVFHVAGGADVLEASRGKAGPLGVFVAPGAIGLTLGILWPGLGWLFAALLALAALAELISAKRQQREEAPDFAGEAADVNSRTLLLCTLLTLAVAVRAIGGTAAVFPWKTGTLATLAMTFCVFLGKTGGGLLCDRLGPRNTALLSLPLSALLIAFCTAWPLPSLLGQLLLNLTMPVTLWLLYRLTPAHPGFAFGIAASALWPGTIAGTLMQQNEKLRAPLVLLSFLFGLFAILYADKRKRNGGEP